MKAIIFCLGLFKQNFSSGFEWAQYVSAVYKWCGQIPFSFAAAGY